MGSKTLKTFVARNRDQWRDWLAEHHRAESAVWLVFNKRHTHRPSIEYGDAVDEALCFGWIDSLIKRLDDDSYIRKFTPRRSDSAWSTANRTRYSRLKADGRLTQAGLDRAPTSRNGDAPRPSLAAIPRDVQQGLRTNPLAWKRFHSLPPSHQRAYVGWIDAAKRAETRTRRLEKAVAMLEAGKPLGMV
jgi:uncharacterized protein YdeI (YjbR/CyaY-like superfamily)